MKNSAHTTVVRARLWIAALALSAWGAPAAVAHCQVPCGIYDDQARVARLLEDAATIEKAMAQIQELSGKNDAQSLNQLTRWVTTKEQHASHIIAVVAEYFLAQRVKPQAPSVVSYDDYLKTLADHHAVVVAAMKAKQNTDPQHAQSLRKAIDRLATHYQEHAHVETYSHPHTQPSAQSATPPPTQPAAQEQQDAPSPEAVQEMELKEPTE